MPKTEWIVGVTNEQLVGWRPRDVVLGDARDFTLGCRTLSAPPPCNGSIVLYLN